MGGVSPVVGEDNYYVQVKAARSQLPNVASGLGRECRGLSHRRRPHLLGLARIV